MNQDDQLPPAIRPALTPQETALLFGKSVWSVYRAIQAGWLPYVRVGSRYYVQAKPLCDRLGLSLAECAELLEQLKAKQADTEQEQSA